MAFRGYGGRRFAGALEGGAVALAYGGVRNVLGTRAAAEIVAKAAAGGSAPTSAQIAAAEKTVLATEEPAIVKWQLPLAGVVLWAGMEWLGAYTGKEAWGEAGEGLGLPGVSDLGQQGTAYARRLMMKVQPAATPGFVGSLRAPRGGAVAVDQSQPAQRTVGLRGYGGGLYPTARF